jgi:hypothetical protein
MALSRRHVMALSRRHVMALSRRLNSRCTRLRWRIWWYCVPRSFLSVRSGDTIGLPLRGSVRISVNLLSGMHLVFIVVEVVVVGVVFVVVVGVVVVVVVVVVIAVAASGALSNENGGPRSVLAVPAVFVRVAVVIFMPVRSMCVCSV